MGKVTSMPGRGNAMFAADGSVKSCPRHILASGCDDHQLVSAISAMGKESFPIQ